MKQHDLEKRLQEELMETFIKTTNPYDHELHEVIRDLYKEGRVEFFVGLTDEIRVRLAGQKVDA